MRSFHAHLEEQKNKNLAFHVFVEMARRGIDPRKFVEWYAEEGMLLSEGWMGQAWNWMKNTYGPSPQVPQAAAPEAGAAPAGPEAAAKEAISNLSAVLARYTNSTLGQNPKLIQGLHNLLGILNSMPAAPATPAATPATPATPAGVPYLPAEPIKHPAGFDPYNDEDRGYAEEGFRYMARNGIDPRRFVEWYAKEGIRLSRHELNEGLGDWWGRLKSRFGAMWGGIKKGWNDAGQAYDDEKIKDVVQHAMQTLQALQADPRFSDANVQQAIQLVLQEMQPKPATPAATPAPGTPAPGTPAPGTPAPGTPATPAATPAPGTPAPGTPLPSSLR